MCLYLTPRETDYIMRPATNGSGDNRALLEELQRTVNAVRHEMDITGAQRVRLQVALRNYRLGCEQQLRHVASAVLRHNG